MDILRNLASAAAHFASARVQRLVGLDRADRLVRAAGRLYHKRPLVLGLLATWLMFAAVPTFALAGTAALWTAAAVAVFLFVVGSCLFWGFVLLFLPALAVATVLSVAAFAWAAAGYWLVGAWVLAALGYTSLDELLGVAPAETPTTLAVNEPKQIVFAPTTPPTTPPTTTLPAYQQHAATSTPSKMDKMDKMDKTDKMDKADKTEKTDKTDKTGKTGKPRPAPVSVPTAADTATANPYISSPQTRTFMFKNETLVDEHGRAVFADSHQGGTAPASAYNAGLGLAPTAVA